MKEKVFISYQDEHNNKVEGYFFLIEQTKNYIKIQSSKNELIIPYHKVNKVKGRELKGGKI